MSDTHFFGKYYIADGGEMPGTPGQLMRFCKGHYIDDTQLLGIYIPVEDIILHLMAIPYKKLRSVLILYFTTEISAYRNYEWTVPARKNAHIFTCNVCNKNAMQKCTNCKTRYCSQGCQKIDWDNNNHRRKCKIIKKEKNLQNNAP